MISLKPFPSTCVVKMEKVQLEGGDHAARAEEFGCVACGSLGIRQGTPVSSGTAALGG